MSKKLTQRFYARQMRRHVQSLPLVQRADRPIAPQGPRLPLHQFVREAWDKIAEHSNRPFIDNWHIHKICEALEAVERGEIVNLAINVPPGHMKSLLCSVFFPAWVWTFDPSAQFLCATCADDLTTRDATRMRDLVTSSWYQSLWPHVRLRHDKNAIHKFQNTAGGFRQSTSVESRITGARADYRIVDDPLSAGDARSTAKRENCRTWYKTEFDSRKNDEQATEGVKQSATIAIGQRLHDEDLFEVFESLGGWDWIVLPSEYDPDTAELNTVFDDPRTEKDALLFPARFDAEVLDRARRTMGELHYAAQHDQQPQSDGGTVFKEEHWKFWRYTGAEKTGAWEPSRFVLRPNNFDVIMISVDCAFKDTASSSFVVIQVWGGIGPDSYLLDQMRKQMGFTDTVRALQTVYAMWPDVHVVLVEDKANGPAVIETLDAQVPGVEPVNPQGGKEVRAHAVTYQISSGHVYLPNPENCEWMAEFLKEHRKFPMYRTDDQVDALTQALVHLRRHNGKLMIGFA